MMVASWLSNATEWVTSAFDQVEELLSAPASGEGEEANHLTAAGEQPYNRTGLISIVLRLLSVSPLEAFNHAKGVVEQKLVGLHNLALDVGQAAAEVSQSATKQVRTYYIKAFLDVCLEIFFRGGAGPMAGPMAGPQLISSRRCDFLQQLIKHDKMM